MNAYYAVLGALAVWRVTHLLQAEDGPWDVVVRLRRLVGNGLLGQMMDCFYCLSVWVSLGFALLIGSNWLERALLWPALSGAAILLERVTNRSSHPPMTFESFNTHEDLTHKTLTPVQANEQEDHNAVLR